jgi:5-hydroxyisourate hydrolase-like protein (transthyretin family)
MKLTRIYKIAVVLLIAFILVACEKQTPVGPDSKIMLHFKGVVIDKTNGSPINNASISLHESTGFGSYDKANVHTDQKGQYSLYYSTKETDNFFRGLYLVARKTGYLQKSAKVQRTDNIQIINFQLEPKSDYN